MDFIAEPELNAAFVAHNADANAHIDKLLHLTGDLPETVTGIKTFSSSPAFAASVPNKAYTADSYNGRQKSDAGDNKNFASEAQVFAKLDKSSVQDFTEFTASDYDAASVKSVKNLSNNVVTINTEQSVTGKKSFADPQYVTAVNVLPNESDSDLGNKFASQKQIVLLMKQESELIDELQSLGDDVLDQYVSRFADVTDIAITQPSSTYYTDTPYQFTANVTGDHMPSQTLVWSVSGGNGSSVIDEDTGLLTIDSSETLGSTLTIVASNVVNAIVDSVTITIS
jgi:hypothetical protein